MNINRISKSDHLAQASGKGFPNGANEQSIEFLNSLLANEYALFTKTLNFHWNVSGPRFVMLHKFLETHYRDLLEIIDDVAERVRVLGARPLSTIDEMGRANAIENKTKGVPEDNDMIKILLEDHLFIQQQIQEILGDQGRLKGDYGTEDFLIGLLRNHEKKSWMLHSLLNY